MNKPKSIKLYNIKETSILVVLDSIGLEKTLAYHDMFLLWSPTFKNVDIPVYLIFPDTIKELNNPNNKKNFNAFIHYVSDPMLIERLNCVQEKFVFGKNIM